MGDAGRAGPATIWPALIACGTAAAWVDFGSIHRLQHSDSLIYALISTWKWTPFYWGQDRFGMLIPWLATPIRHPLANLLAQDFLNIFAGLSAFVLLARYVLRDGSAAVVGLLCVSVFLATVPGPYQAMYLIDASYGVWLVPGLSALIVLDRGGRGPSAARAAWALALMVLAHWINFATAVVLGPLVAARALVFARIGASRGSGWTGVATSETAVALGVLALGAGAGRLLASLATTREPTSLDSLAPMFWPDGWIELGKNLWGALAPGHLPAASVAASAIGLASLAIPTARRRSSTAWRAAGALGATAIALWLYAGTRYWVKVNGYTYRYLIPAAMMLQLASTAVALGPWSLAPGPRWRRGLYAASAASTIGAAWWGFGPPSASGVRRDIDGRCGALTADLIAGRCTHLVGDYYKVWPAVFHAAIALRERGEPRVVWGVALRAEETEPLWRGVPARDVRIAVPIGDPEADRRLRAFGFPRLVPVERRSTILIYRFREAPGRPPSWEGPIPGLEPPVGPA